MPPLSFSLMALLLYLPQTHTDEKCLFAHFSSSCYYRFSLAWSLCWTLFNFGLCLCSSLFGLDSFPLCPHFLSCSRCPGGDICTLSLPPASYPEHLAFGLLWASLPDENKHQSRDRVGLRTGQIGLTIYLHCTSP